MLAFSSITFASITENSTLIVSADSEKKDLQISVFQNTEDHRYIVSFKNDTNEPVELAVEDENGDNIYSEMVRGRGVYNKRFDLVNLVDGQYTVKVGNRFVSLVKDLVIR